MSGDLTMQPEARRLIVLGSTGSIGVNTLNVVEHLNMNDHASFDVVGLAAGANVELLAEQAARFAASHVALADGEAANGASWGDRTVFRGPDAALELVEAVAQPGDLVMAAMVGSAGLPATIAAIERGCDIALANKETLVAAGGLVMPLVREHGVALIPVDSEHSGVAQCLRSCGAEKEIRRIVLTASGGPFRTWTPQAIHDATVEQALNHPTWSMGRKNTIDSASMVNKALEVVEAHWLFDLAASQVDVLVHPQSMIHSFVEFVDNSVIVQLGPPDMKTPIQVALTWPHRLEGCSVPMDWTAMRQLDFEPVDPDRFPALALAYRVIEEEGTSGAAFNAANEVVVEAFLAGEVPFGWIAEIVRATMDELGASDYVTLDELLTADRTARDVARRRMQTMQGPIATVRSSSRAGARST